MVSHYPTDHQVAVTHQDIQQWVIHGREEDDSKQVNMDVNNAGFEMFFMSEEMYSTHSSELKDSQSDWMYAQTLQGIF